MDTRFWGPSGWRLLHLVATAPTGNRASAVLEWVRLLEYVLPCKYCRTSFHDYVRAYPLTLSIVRDPAAFSRWMYTIHTCVNDKLRGQGLLTTRNPDWPTVRDRFSSLHASLCTHSPSDSAESSALLGWDFMTSVAFATPGARTVSTPMAGAEEMSFTHKSDESDLNRFNVLSRRSRLLYMSRWWALVPSILPCAAWRTAWQSAFGTIGQPPLDRGRDAVMRWMWRLEEGVCGRLQCPTPHASCSALERTVGAFESGCSVARRGKTCRMKKKQTQRYPTQPTKMGEANGY